MTPARPRKISRLSANSLIGEPGIAPTEPGITFAPPYGHQRSARKKHGDAATRWWWGHLAAQANDLRKTGFTAVWLPPVLKTSAGAHPGSDGYGPFDDYESIGARPVPGGRPEGQ